MAKKIISRRSIIKSTSLAAAGLCNLSFFSKNIIEGLFNQAMAQQLGILDKKYIFIQQAGAPNTWFFAGALYPDGDPSKFITCEQVGTRFKAGGSRYTEIEYATTQVQGISMPWLWRFNIPRPDGESIPMSNLAAEGMISIKGVNTNNPSHEPAQSLQCKPLGISNTLNALTADVSGLPIGGVNLSSYRYQFSSTKGLSSVFIGSGGNMIEKLMKPFIKPNLGSFETDTEKVALVLKNTRAIIDQLAKQKYPGVEAIANSTESAISLISRDFGDMDLVFNTLKAKYRDLIQRAIAPGQNLEGITDKPVGPTSGRTPKHRYGGETAVTNPDMRDVITSATNADIMASHFACTEFCILNNISSSISLRPDGLRNLSVQNGNNTQSFDEHTSGGMMSLLVSTHYYLALTSCIYELIQQLKGAGMWENTVIRLEGEFGRCPKNDGTGSDHSAEGQCVSMFSGNLDGLSVIGNITANGGKGRLGTWGYGANNDNVGGLNLGHTTSTLADLLGLDSPVTAVESLLKNQGSKKVAKIPPGKII